MKCQLITVLKSNKFISIVIGGLLPNILNVPFGLIQYTFPHFLHAYSNIKANIRSNFDHNFILP